MLFFLLFGVMDFSILTFAVRPLPSPAPCIRLAYTSYQDRIDGGFPDAALSSIIRKDYLNLVTLLAGLGHKKRIVFHHWVRWLVSGFNMAHTVPYIVAPLHDGGHAALHKHFYKLGGFKLKQNLMLGNMWLLTLG